MPRLALIPGDGIGKEVVPAAVRVIEAAAALDGLPLEFVRFDLDADHYLRTGVGMPDDVFVELRDRCDAIFLGALGDPRVPDSAHARDILLGLRRRLDLFVNFRPARLISPALCPLKDVRDSDQVDLVIFRENTEGLYCSIGGSIHTRTRDEVATENMVCTWRGVERIQRAAFEYAVRRGGLRVCMVDKSNALRNVGDLWLRVFRELSAEFSQIEARHLYVDAAAMELVRDPSQFDVIVTGNLFGDILSDLAAALIGGMGLATSANIAPGRPGLYEPVHGSAPDIAGKGIANPTAAILTGAMMLEHLGAPRGAEAMQRAIAQAIAERACTRDIGGDLGTEAAADAVIARLS